MNRLRDEKSPYLLQHADNPVDWYPWGKEAFEKARRDDRPIFLSIGYSTCHWCHVMAHESFADPHVGDLMNAAFVSIKVDREERPDIDNLYMKISQMMTGSGGWPLTVLMTPEGKPFYAATYLPRESRFGRVGMLDLVPRVKQLWDYQRGDLLSLSERVTRALEDGRRRTPAEGSSGPAPGQAVSDGQAVLDGAYRQLSAAYDEEHGGFGGAPKFPTPHNLLFLLRYWKRTGEAAARTMVEQTLQAMRRGGIYDHLGYGFHRYSTDAEWKLPHFEKMLYDQALLALAYTEAFQATGRPFYADVAREILTYVLRDLRSPEGAFFSAEDADSEGEEGRFYLWTREELAAGLDPDEADLVQRHYGVQPEGNFVDPVVGRRSGANVLHASMPLAEIARETGRSVERLEETFTGARRKLLARRETRVRPGLDDKVLTDWNGLAIAALARAAAVLEEPRYAAAARDCLEFLRAHLWRPGGGLLHRYRDGQAGVTGQAADYAYLTWGLLELYELTFDTACLRQALELEERLFTDFRDREAGGYFMTGGQEDLLIRPKETVDGALPAANSVALLNLLRLAAITGRTELEQRADELVRAFYGEVRSYPAGFTQFLSGVDFSLGPGCELVIVGHGRREDTRRLVQAARRRYLPGGVMLVKDLDAGAAELEELAPYTRDQKALRGRATAFVCRERACAAPTHDVERMIELLDG